LARVNTASLADKVAMAKAPNYMVGISLKGLEDQAVHEVRPPL
jgi:hypothetical protein